MIEALPLQACHSAAAPLAMWQASNWRPANVLQASCQHSTNSHLPAGRSTPAVLLDTRVALQPLTAASRAR